MEDFDNNIQNQSNLAVAVTDGTVSQTDDAENREAQV